MIVPNQQNLKVHFAALENSAFAEVFLKICKVKYSLFTVFPFISQCLKIKSKTMNYNIAGVNMLQDLCNHVIMDSGLFTLMFGSHAGKRGKQEIDLWYNSLIEFVVINNLTCTCVEVDCQKILGVEEAWKYRIKMKQELKNRQINVFHLDDGQKGLDRLIEFSDYLAISVPELRATGKKHYINKIANYIKNKKPSIDIHLLGCTENKILKELNFCSSSDSTSWGQVNRYGQLNYNDGKKTHVIKNRHINIDVLKNRYGKQLTDIISKYYEPNEKRFDYFSKYAIAVELLLKQYTTYAGDQN